VVRFVIWQVVLEQVESFVDGLGQAEFLDQEMDGADAAAGEGVGLVSDVVMDIGGVKTGSGEGAVTGRSSRRRILRLPAAWWRCGMGFTRDLLGVSAMGWV